MPTLTPDDYKAAIRKLQLKTRYLGSTAANVMVTCPYHYDKHPSMSIHIRTGAYNCFQCHRQGHLSELVWNRVGISIYNLLDINTKDDELDNYLKIAKVEEPPIDPKKIMDKVSINIRGVLVPWEESEAAIEYLRIRNIDPVQANLSGMSYSEDAIINKMFYKKRLCIPIYDDKGTLINLEGRDTTFLQDKKCIYPMNTIKPLYEWYKLSYIRPVFIFEGLIKMLVARSDEYFTNSTTNFGSYFSELQAFQLKLFRHVIIVPDNDRPGEEFIKQVYFHKNPKATVQVMRIINPEIKDADEIPKKSGMSVKDFRLSGGFILEQNLL